MTRVWPVLSALALSACGAGVVEGDTLDPLGDDDGDGFTNQEEDDAGSDPLDEQDVPYQGGWKKGDCGTIEPTGDDVGDVAEDFAITDQYGDTVHLHDFCDRVVLIEFSGFS